MKSGLESSGGLFFFDPATLSEFSTGQATDCSSVIALAEPGSASKHDFWLLLTGALLSAGLGLAIEMLTRRGKPRDSRDDPSRDKPTPPATTPSSGAKGRA